MKVYVAAPWDHRDIARIVGHDVTWAGFEVVSRWLQEHGDSTDHAHLQREALHDQEDLRAADVLLLLNLGKSDGKATEFGMALERGIPVIVVGGDKGNVFYHLPGIIHCVRLSDALTVLENLQKNGLMSAFLTSKVG